MLGLIKFVQHENRLFEEKSAQGGEFGIPIETFLEKIENATPTEIEIGAKVGKSCFRIIF